MIPFLKQVQQLLHDRQEFKFTAKKVGDDLVTTIIPDAKGKGKLFDITIPAEDLNRDDIDHIVFGELTKDIPEEKTTFQVSKDDAPEAEEDDADEKSEKKETPTGKKPADKKGVKKQPAKKQAPKKQESKKQEPKEPEVKAPVQEAEPTEEEPVATTEPTQEESPEPKPDKTKSVKKDKVKQPELELPETVGEVADQAPEPVEEKAEILPNNLNATFEAFMCEGKKQMEDRNYDEAVSNFEEAVKLNPNDDKAQKELAKARTWKKATDRMKVS